MEKGSGAQVGDAIQLCENENLPSALTDGEGLVVLAFLVGSDGTRWVPKQGGAGLVPANSDGTFDLGRAVNGDAGSVDLQRVRALARGSKIRR